MSFRVPDKMLTHRDAIDTVDDEVLELGQAFQSLAVDAILN